MKKEELTRGRKAVLARARLLTEFEWTPVRDIPTFTKATGKTVLPAGKTVKGMIYSSTEPTDKFVTENISFETFSTIVNNPDSALYNKDLGGHNNSWAYFGIVCNGLARYALNIPGRYSTKRWLTVPGMHKIYEASEYTVDQIEICDVLYVYGKERKHVALITDVICDEKGQVQQIEVSEAIRPTCVRRQFTPEEFYEKFKLFGICRYDFLDSVPEPDPTDSAFVSGKLETKLPNIALDYGNKTNYRACEDVIISTFLGGENEIEIYKGDDLLERFSISGKGKEAKRFDRGYYTVKLPSTGETLEFCVTDPEITYSVNDGVLSVNANSCDPDSQIIHMDFRGKSKGGLRGTDDEQTSVKYYNPCCASLSKLEKLTEEEKATGKFSRKIPDDAGNFKVYFKNKYGIWTHTMINFRKGE